MDAGTAIVTVAVAVASGGAGVLGSRWGANATLSAAREAAGNQARIAREQQDHDLRLERERRRQDRQGVTYVAAVRFAQRVGLLTKEWYVALGTGDMTTVDELMQRERRDGDHGWLAADEELRLWAEIHVFGSEDALRAFKGFVGVVDAGRQVLIAALTAHREGDYKSVAAEIARLESHMAEVEATGEHMAEQMRTELAGASGG
ncbi:MAG: hypothetical protein JO265_03800 [Acidimicrobiia bacterium]|nr:hypothetical protein [Acidimicrobiia bacterium]